MSIWYHCFREEMQITEVQIRWTSGTRWDETTFTVLYHQHKETNWIDSVFREVTSNRNGSRVYLWLCSRFKGLLLGNSVIRVQLQLCVQLSLLHEQASVCTLGLLVSVLGAQAFWASVVRGMCCSYLYWNCWLNCTLGCKTAFTPVAPKLRDAPFFLTVSVVT